MEYKVNNQTQKILCLIALGLTLEGVFTIYDAVTGDYIFRKVFLMIWLGGVSFVVYYILKQPSKNELNNVLWEFHFRDRFLEKSLNISSLIRIIVDNQALSFHFENTKSIHAPLNYRATFFSYKAENY